MGEGRAGGRSVMELVEGTFVTDEPWTSSSLPSLTPPSPSPPTSPLARRELEELQPEVFSSTRCGAGVVGVLCATGRLGEDF